MRKIKRDLKRLPHVNKVEITNGGHYRLTLDNGTQTFTGSTPSDRKVGVAVRAQVRKMMRRVF